MTGTCLSLVYLREAGGERQETYFASGELPMTTTADIATQLETTFGLTGVELRYGLSQDELFHEAIAHDRGRVEIDGSDDAQKAFATSLGVDGPLVYFSDPECTGRPVKDTYCVNRPAPPAGSGGRTASPNSTPTHSTPFSPGHRPPQRATAPPVCRRCLLRLGSDLRRAVPIRRRVRDPRLLLQHHVPEGRA